MGKGKIKNRILEKGTALLRAASKGRVDLQVKAAELV